MAAITTLTLNPSVDVSTSVDHVAPEDKLRCERPRREPGGGGLNVARAVCRIGGEACALWTCGGANGAQLRGLLDADCVEHQPIPITGETRESFIVFETSSGRQYRFGMPGPDLDADELERCLEALREHPADYQVLSGSLPPGAPEDTYARAVRRAPAGTRVVVDTSGPALARSLGEGVFLIKPNLRELAALVDRPVDDDRQIREAACGLVRRGQVEVVVVSIGAGGVILATADGAEHIRAPTVPIRSKVGAGDSTVAGIVLGLSRGMELSRAVRFGVAAGSAAVSTPGTELCRREDVERLFAELT